jgi:predicted butyrate kinase (DUF1464 family)
LAVLRVVGSDPGTSSLDLLLLGDGVVIDQVRLLPAQLRDDSEILARLLNHWRPIDLVAAPSGYGLPLVRGEAFCEDHLEQMSLVRPDERGRESGIVGFRAWVRAFVRSGASLVFLPGGLHLPTIPAHRKVGAVDFGTADKVAVAALALWFDASAAGGWERSRFAVVEIGSAFSAILVVDHGGLVDASAGTRGPIGLRSGGGWDGEVAYWRSPLTKDDLFHGGLADLGPLGPDAVRESLIKHVAGLRAVTPFERIYLSGRGLEQPEIARLVADALARFGRVSPLPWLPGAWVKHAAQGAAILADGLAGGRYARVAESLQVSAASGSVWDALRGSPGSLEIQA